MNEQFPPDQARRQRLSALVDEHFAFVWRSMCRLGVPRADAEDAAQEVFLVLARRLADVDVGRERAFLFATAARVACTRRRGARRRREEIEPSFDECVAAGLDPEELSALVGARATLSEILDGMNDELRAVFVLHELEELSVPEIAELLAVPRGTVSWRLASARDLFAAAAKRAQVRAAFPGRAR